LLKPSKSGETPILMAATFGFLSQIPSDIIKDGILNELIISKNTNLPTGSPILFEAISQGQLAAIPKVAFSEEACNLTDKKGNNILHIIYSTFGAQTELKKLGTMPINWDKLLEKNKDGKTPLEAAIIGGYAEYIPRKYINAETLGLEQVTPGRGTDTILHQAATYAQLHTLPMAEIPLQLILQPDSEGRTVLHLAGLGGQLTSMPEDMLQYINKNLVDIEGNNVLHYAARGSQLMQTPREVITKELILARNKKGYTALDIAIERDETEVLLGLELPEEYKEKLPKEWWDQNTNILNQRDRLANAPNEVEIDLF